ncbi:MAG: cation-translocating P-type ATPase [Candidatus Poseidoniaceae archaeon]|nr:cation-translocating P-type ATPase [Candidatus Poseidoniaceae archaeon]
MVSDADEDVFLSLEEDSAPKPAPLVKKTTSRKKPKPAVLSKPEKEQPILDAEVLDATIIEQATGQFQVGWPLLGMDCPDCATKAVRALKTLKQTDEVQVSATAGTVRLKVDFEHGHLAEVSSVLRSLGHAPDVEFNELVGAKASAVAARNGVDRRKLGKVLRQQPGVLDVELSDDDRIILQLVPDASMELFEKRNRALEHITGTPLKLVTTQSDRLRPDQWRLIGGGIALPLLALVILGEILGWSNTMLGVIAVPGLLIGGSQMFKEAIASLANRQMGFQVLTSLAVIGAAILNMWEEALIVAILVAFTAHLEGDALLQARNAMQGGLDRLPRKARRLTGVKSTGNKVSAAIMKGNFTLSMAASAPLLGADGCALPDPNAEHEEVPIELVRNGDQLEIRSGELIPADGTIVEGHGALDKAPLTGESVPVEVSKGDQIQAGLVLARGPVIIEVTAVGDDTRLSGLIDAVHTFREEPPKLQNLIERFTAIWVPIVLFGAFAVWQFMFPDDWKIILLLWVVACPCALLLATPVPHAAALARSAHIGAIARGGDVIERLSKVNHVLLDKTGTLTSGKPRIGEVVMAKGRKRDGALRLAAGLEARSSHPYAMSVMDYVRQESLVPTKVNVLADIEAGVRGKVGGKDVAFLRYDRAGDLNISVCKELKEAYAVAESKGHGASLLARDGEALALFTFIHDDTRDGSHLLIPSLFERGITVEILSGDNEAAVKAFAKSVGLPEESAHGGLSPEDKVKWVRGRSQTKVTMMVGDGFNDAAALAVADVGVAVGSGETVNLEAADVLVPGDDPQMLTELIDLARRAQRILVGNLIITVGITLALVGAVITQMYDQLWVGVLIHEASVILVILNGARLAGSEGGAALLRNIFISLWRDTKSAFSLLRTRIAS